MRKVKNCISGQLKPKPTVEDWLGISGWKNPVAVIIRLLASQDNLIRAGRENYNFVRE
jgi:hypothetical protein